MPLTLLEFIVKVINRTTISLCKEVVPVACSGQPKLKLSFAEKSSDIRRLTEEVLDLDAFYL